jgi:bacterioferritin-associated ferredoxin
VKLDDELCLCFHVTKRKVINYIRVERPRRPAQLADCFGAGAGCGWCRTYLAKLLQSVNEELAQGLAKEQSKELAKDPSAVADEPDASQYAAGRTSYVKAGGGTPPPGATPIDEPG